MVLLKNKVYIHSVRTCNVSIEENGYSSSISAVGWLACHAMSFIHFLLKEQKFDIFIMTRH